MNTNNSITNEDKVNTNYEPYKPPKTARITYSKQELLDLFYPSESLPEGFTYFSTITSLQCKDPVNLSGKISIGKDENVNPSFRSRPFGRGRGSRRARGRGRGGDPSRGRGSRSRPFPSLREKEKRQNGSSTEKADNPFQTLCAEGRPRPPPLGEPPVGKNPFDSAQSAELNKQERELLAIATQERSWVYKNKEGNLQGPFELKQFEEWLDAGFFARDLKVKRLGQGGYQELGEILKQYAAQKQKQNSEDKLEDDSSGFFSGIINDIMVDDDHKPQRPRSASPIDDRTAWMNSMYNAPSSPMGRGSYPPVSPPYMNQMPMMGRGYPMPNPFPGQFSGQPMSPPPPPPSQQQQQQQQQQQHQQQIQHPLPHQSNVEHPNMNGQPPSQPIGTNPAQVESMLKNLLNLSPNNPNIANQLPPAQLQQLIAMQQQQQQQQPAHSQTQNLQPQSTPELQQQQQQQKTSSHSTASESQFSSENVKKTMPSAAAVVRGDYSADDRISSEIDTKGKELRDAHQAEMKKAKELLKEFSSSGDSKSEVVSEQEPAPTSSSAASSSAGQQQKSNKKKKKKKKGKKKSGTEDEYDSDGMQVVGAKKNKKKKQPSPQPTLEDISEEESYDEQPVREETKTTTNNTNAQPRSSNTAPEDTLASKLGWDNANQSQPAWHAGYSSQPLDLSTIQKEQKKKSKKQKDQRKKKAHEELQVRQQKIAEQEMRRNPWGHVSAAPKGSVSFTEIQNEQKKKAKKKEEESTKKKKKTAAAGGTPGAWSAVASAHTSKTPSMAEILGESQPKKKPEHPSGQQKQNKQKPQPKAEKKESKKQKKAKNSSSSTTAKDGDDDLFWSYDETAQVTPADASNLGASEPSPEFKAWCKKELKKLTKKNDLTLMYFLLGQEDDNIKDYAKLYLNDSPSVDRFAEEFVRLKQFESTPTKPSKKKKRKK